MSLLRARRITVAGIATPLLEAGPADASEAVVFVHGNPGSSSDWTELLDTSGRHARAIAVDNPGFGKADAPADFAYTVPAYAEFLNNVLEQLGIVRVHLVLHDFGGPIGLEWGVAHPEQWASVTLINIGVLPGYRWHRLARVWRTPLLGELSQAYIPRRAWRSLMREGNPRGLPDEFVEKMYDDYDKATRRTVLKLYRATDLSELAAAQGPALAALRRPALVVWGASDPYLGVDYAERQREFFDVRDSVRLADSGHWPFQDNPAVVREALERFLPTQLPLAAPA